MPFTPKYFRSNENMADPSLDVPPTIDQLKELISYHRATNHADSAHGFALCGKVNLGSLKHLKRNYPGIEILPLVCNSFKNIRKSGGLTFEHFIGVVKTDKGYVWFDGTADQ